MSEDASMFWCSLETYYKPEEIRKKLFTLDEYSVSTLQRINKYLKLEYYYMLKKRLKEFELTAYVSSISAFDTSKKYDFINLSNIATYYHNLSTLKTDIDNIKRLLTNEGLLLLSYLYECDNNTKAGIFWEPVYKLPKVYEIFQGEDLRLICFDSISNYEENTDKKDSVLLLKK